MSELNGTQEMRRALGEVLEETTAELEHHPDPDRLFAYSAGELTEEDEEEIRDHLSLCRDCVDRLWLDPEDPIARDRTGVVDLEVHKAWREMVAQIREIRAGKRLEKERKRTRLYQIAAAASLLLAAGLAWRVSETPSPHALVNSSGASGPTVNVGVYDVTRSRVRSGSAQALEPVGPQGGQETILTIPEAVDSFTLIFLLESGEYDSYELKILDSGKNEIWNTRKVLVQEDHATLSLSRESFTAGEYFVEIYCWRQGQATVWEYPIRLVYK